MKVFETKRGYLVRLERGEEVHAALTSWAAETGLTGAALSGLGAAQDVELGFYHLDRREYERRAEHGPFEILSLTGNLSVVSGRPLLHAHVVLMRDDFTLTGGHLFRAVISVTGEFAITHADLHLTREPDDRVGLSLLEEAGP